MNKPIIQVVREFIDNLWEVRNNIVLNKFEFREKNKTEWEELNENDIYVALKMEFIKFSLSDLRALLKSSWTKKHDPIKEYFENLPPWDGETDYIKELISYIHVNDNDKSRFEKQFKKALIRSVACALGYAVNKHAFILVSPKQHGGKTTFIRWLCPPELMKYYTEELKLDKDGLAALTNNFIINLDELSTMQKAEINQLKSHFSKDYIKIRLPYDARESTLKRRSNFFGSTNLLEFLSDETGNVRWICFRVLSINYDYSIKMNIDNVWMQAYSLFKSKIDYQLSKDEVEENEKSNAQFFINSSEIELIQQYYTQGSKENQFSKFLTATEILIHLLNKTGKAIKLTERNIGRALKALNFGQETNYCKDSKFSIKGYWLIETEPMPF
jgi:predicted P-loop ATPase